MFHCYECGKPLDPKDALPAKPYGYPDEDPNADVVLCLDCDLEIQPED